MKDLHPYITNDGSVGLYSSEFDDIYHSTFGAYTEACEKFVLAADLPFYIKNCDEINVLDICYGIGYNTKSFLHFYLKKISEQKLYVDAIDYDNIFATKKVYIKAIDTDKNLMFLSPFFTCNAKKIIGELPTNKVKRLSSRNIEKFYDYNNAINFILIDNLKRNFSDFLRKRKFNGAFFDNYAVFYNNICCTLSQKASITGVVENFLHNIYYWYISKRYNVGSKALSDEGISIDYAVDDARKIILNDNKMYQLIFLDAFTPTKCPCLWTLDFFKLLFEHLDDNGKILTYSNSAQVRHAFLHAGFFVGKIYNERTKSFTGTIAVKNKNLIKHELSEYDLRLMKTRAGIFYRDKNLTGLNEAIIEAHKKEVDESPLISSSKFIKQYRKEHVNV